MNFYLGIGGPVTFKNALDRKEVVREIPLECILLETDAPYLTPHPHRGQRNEPAYIPLIAAEIAALQTTSPEEVAQITTENANHLFHWN
jgi:TatD DNase family protein